MRPNCYTYSAVMNALAKSCSALRVVNNGNTSSARESVSRRKTREHNYNLKQQQQYDPAKEAQNMLENMIVKYDRYIGRVDEGGVVWRGNGSGVYYGDGRRLRMAWR